MNILKKIWILSCVFGAFSFSQTFAAGIDHFEVIISPSNAKIEEALDITIEAVDKNNETVTDYDGTILVFPIEDQEAEFPNELKENSYTFTAADEGKVKFENAIIFKNPWVQHISVIDLYDDTVEGSWEVTISEGDTNTQNIEIEILSPENGMTIGTSTVTISWLTKKNHRVILEINNLEEISTTSDSEWVFEKNIENLQDGENFIIAYVLDADNNKIGESNTVNIKINSSAPLLQSVSIDPTGEVEAETPIEIEVISNQGLASVETILDDVLTSLEETQNGIYKGTIYAPKEPGTYEIDVILTDDFGHETQESGAISINVIPWVLNVAEEEEEEEPTIEEEKPILSAAEEKKDPLKITGIKLTVLKTKSILTWDKNEKAESYNIYKKKDDDTLEFIQNVKEAHFEVPIAASEEITYDYFAIKWVAKTASGETYEGDLSEATKIQTGPELILLLFLALLGGVGFIAIKRKTA